MRLVSVPPDTLIGFKALPTWDPSLEDIVGGNNTGMDSLWAGLYPQLSLRSAVNYLPNQWDRGFEEASIVKLRSKSVARFLVCDDPRMADVRVTSREKARLVAEQVRETFGLELCHDEPLVHQLGAHGYCLCLLDAEDYELVIPHSLLHNFSADVVLKFKRHPTIPAITGSVEGLSLPRYVLQDPGPLADHLEVLFEDHCCPEMRRILGI